MDDRELCSTKWLFSLGNTTYHRSMTLFSTDINALTTDFDFNVLDKDVSNPVQPAEGLASRDGNAGKLDTKVDTVDQITVA